MWASPHPPPPTELCLRYQLQSRQRKWRGGVLDVKSVTQRNTTLENVFNISSLKGKPQCLIHPFTTKCFPVLGWTAVPLLTHATEIFEAKNHSSILPRDSMPVTPNGDNKTLQSQSHTCSRAVCEHRGGSSTLALLCPVLNLLSLSPAS